MHEAIITPRVRRREPVEPGRVEGVDDRTFAARVAEQAGLAKEEALDLTRATLEQLGGQLSGGESRELALDLPIELAEHVAQHDGQAHPEPLRNFTRHLRERTGLNQDEVTRGLRVILATLSELPDSARVQHALSQLPAEYRELART